MLDEPTTWAVNEGEWTPGNYDDEYDGMITLRRALALSRNVATIKVAEQAGFSTVASLWTRTGLGTDAAARLPVDRARRLRAHAARGGRGLHAPSPRSAARSPLRAITRIVNGGQDRPLPAAGSRRVAEPAVTYLVTNMMRSVLNEGTAASARAAGFALDAAGKTGTTNDLRDAWFVGFTPELLTVVWVGLDDNQVLGLSGGQSALPIWTAFMKRALAGRPNVPFSPPPGIVELEIDRDTGHLALPDLPARHFRGLPGRHRTGHMVPVAPVSVIIVTDR